jgi:hypothetical protein
MLKKCGATAAARKPHGGAIGKEYVGLEDGRRWIGCVYRQGNPIAGTLWLSSVRRVDTVYWDVKGKAGRIAGQALLAENANELAQAGGLDIHCMRRLGRGIGDGVDGSSHHQHDYYQYHVRNGFHP